MGKTKQEAGSLPDVMNPLSVCPVLYLIAQKQERNQKTTTAATTETEKQYNRKKEEDSGN